VKDPTTPRRKTFTVWALPISLAATHGIDFSFFSSRYLDVSLPWVGHVYLCIQHTLIRESRDQYSFVSYPKLFADFHALHRLLMPRHPPCALSNLTTETSNSHKPNPNPCEMESSCSNRRIGVPGLIYPAYSTQPYGLVSIFRLSLPATVKEAAGFSRSLKIVSPIQISKANPNWQSSCCAIYPCGQIHY